MKKTYVVGHKNPDTDSVMAAISLAYLKNQLGLDVEARVLGEINEETQYALNYFKLPKPKFLTDVKVRIEDIPFKKNLMINEYCSIFEAYTKMINGDITGLPVVSAGKIFVGYVSLKEIATDLIKGKFDILNTSYNNILKVLNGKDIVRIDEEIAGTIISAASSTELFMSSIDFADDKIVIVGNRKNVINYCLEKKAKLIILVGNQSLTEDEIKLAKKNQVNVIETPLLTFEVSKLIGLSNYIKNILRHEKPVTFSPQDYLSEFYELSNKYKHTNYPIVTKKGQCAGMLRLVDITDIERKKVILVDHNEVKQSVDGLGEATILEVIDHHAIGSLTTSAPVSFRNMIVGSTNTIIYKLFQEARVDIPKSIAGAMLSGLLSDTLILKSPTTTETDRVVAKSLARKANVNIEQYGLDMIKAGSLIKNKTPEDVIFSDYKEFECNGTYFGISQITTLDYDKILSNKDKYIKVLTETSKEKNFRFILIFITDIIQNGSYLLYSDGCERIISSAYDIEDLTEGAYLQDVISRKKQMLPPIINELTNK